MPDIYPKPTNMSGVQGLFSHADSIVGGLFGVGALAVIYVSIIVIMVHKHNRISDSFATSGVISLILGALLFSGGLLLDKYLIIILAMALISIIWSIFDR